MLFTAKDKQAIEDSIGAVSDSVKDLSTQMQYLANEMPNFRKITEAERGALVKAVAEAEKRLGEGAKAHADLVQARHELLKVGNTVKTDAENTQAKLADRAEALVVKAEERMQRRADEIAQTLDKKTNTIGGMMHDLIDAAKAEVVGFVEAQVNTTLAASKQMVAETKEAIRLVQNKADSIKSFDRKLDLLDDKLKTFGARLDALEKAKTPAAPATANAKR